MVKNGKNRKSDIVTMLAVAGYVLFLVVGFPAAERAGGFYPALMILAAAVFLKERISATTWVGIALITAGIVLVI